MRLMQMLTEVGTIKVSGTLELQKSRERSIAELFIDERDGAAGRTKEKSRFKKKKLVGRSGGGG